VCCWRDTLSRHRVTGVHHKVCRVIHLPILENSSRGTVRDPGTPSTRPAWTLRGARTALVLFLRGAAVADTVRVSEAI